MRLTHNDDVLALVADRMRAIGDPLRLRLLSLLRERDATVGELTALVGASQQNVSHHLAVLYRDGILTRRKEGRKVWYSLHDETVSAVCDAVCESVTRQAAGPNHVAHGGVR